MMADRYEIAEAGVPFDPTEYPVDDTNGLGGMGFSVGSFLAVAGNDLPSYWSPARDGWLREFVTKSDPLKVATSTFINKLVSVPVLISPRDNTITEHAEVATRLQRNLMELSGWMRGFREELKKIARDYLETDNGCFALVMGRGASNRPILGAALGILHLDSFRCQRTGDPEFPVVYLHTNGKRYALHYTRVIMMSNLPSADAAMHGVGLCAVSCAIQSAKELNDIATFSAEKMGSRPPRQILFAETGATISELSSAVAVFEQKMQAQGLQRFSKTLLLAPKSANQTLKLNKVDLASVPDGFDRHAVSTLDLSLLAAAFGLDLHDLSIALNGSSSNSSSAEVQSKKGRGKGVHEFIETFTDQFSRRFLPDYLTFQFDEVDDDADEQRASIAAIRSTARERNLSAGVTTLRIERLDMLRHGDISQEDFNMLELADGRTPTGMDILYLFYSTDTDLAQWLGNFSVPEPTDIMINDAASVVSEIRARQIEVYKVIEASSNSKRTSKARMALYALQKLETLYLEAPPPDMDMNERVAIEAMDESGQIEQIQSEGAEDADPNLVEEGGSGIEKQLPFGLTDITEDDRRVLESAISEYNRDFDALVVQARSGEMPENEFIDAVVELSSAILLLLFMRGSRLALAQLLESERVEIVSLLDISRSSAVDFGRQLYLEATSLLDKPISLAQAFARVGLWVNMAIAAFSAGQLVRRDNPRFRWNRSILKDSCEDCVRLDGQVHTAEQWRLSGWRPRATHLACHGFNCGCNFTETQEGERGEF